MKLSIIIPLYNEEKTVATVLQKVIDVSLPKVTKEIIIVDDGSTDASASKIKDLRFKIKDFKIISHKKNLGKGAAVRTGIKHATGDYILIQDADLEYNPKQIRQLVHPILANKTQVVYGTRLNRLPNIAQDERTPLFFLHYLGNRFLSLITSFLYGQWLTDMETCYKMFPKKAVANIQLHARGFEFEPEITAKFLKKGYAILEIPIRTTPRSFKEGKKLNTVKDGIKAFWALIKYRFVD